MCVGVGIFNTWGMVGMAMPSSYHRHLRALRASIHGAAVDDDDIRTVLTRPRGACRSRRPGFLGTFGCVHVHVHVHVFACMCMGTGGGFFTFMSRLIRTLVSFGVRGKKGRELETAVRSKCGKEGECPCAHISNHQRSIHTLLTTFDSFISDIR